MVTWKAELVVTVTVSPEIIAFGVDKLFTTEVLCSETVTVDVCIVELEI